MPVCKIWRVPVCKTESLRWNVTVAEPDTNGCSNVRVDATLSGNPDPAADSIQVRVEARAPLLAGERLVVGPVPAGHVSTNVNARAWLVVSWTRPATRSPAASEPHAESAENTAPDSHAGSEGAEEPFLPSDARSDCASVPGRGCGRLRAMIVYFTGTGNSLAAARRLAERTADLFA